MKNIIKNIVCMTFLSLAFVGVVANADIYNQNFDTWTGAPQSGYTSSTDSSGWSAVLTKIQGEVMFGIIPFSEPYMASITLNGYVLSPNLANGINDISFQYTVDGTLDATFAVQISSDGSNWTTLDTISTVGISARTWYAYSKNNINQYGDSYFRVKVLTYSNVNRTLAIDSVSITAPAADLNITGTTVIPDNIYDGTEATVVTDIEKLGNVQNLAVTAYWKPAGGTWTSANMTNTTGNSYVAVSSIPGQIAGTKVEYYVGTTFTSANSPKYSPSGGASSPYSYNVQVQAFTSKFEAMDVDIVPIISPPGTPQTVTMFLDGNDYRQGVALYDGYLNGINFNVDATTTNSVEEAYGTSSSNSFATPFSADLSLDGDSFSVPEFLVAQVLFRVQEEDMSISVAKCVYMDFNDWPDTEGYTDSIYSFAYKVWSAYNTDITTDNERKFRGQAAYLNSTGATSYVRSPEIDSEQGFGELTFWYRNFSGAGEEASFDIQVSDTGGTLETEWSTVTNVTGIYSTEYLRFTRLMNDRSSSYVRIKNTGDSNLCIDDILIGYAPAGITLNNIVLNPASPNVLDEVDVEADITALQGATNIVAKLYYRFGTSGNYLTTVMTNSSDVTYYAESPFEAGCNGTLQYYFEVTFGGSRGQETVVYPSGGATIPYELEYTDISYEQDFDEWPGAPQSSPGASSDSTGWSVDNTAVKKGVPFVLDARSTNYCAVVDYLGYVQSPILTNGFGVLSFWYGFSATGYQIDIQIWSNESGWETIDSVGFAGFRVWNQYRRVFPIKGINALYIRLKSSAQQAGRLILIDDIKVTLPSSMLTIGTQTRTPAYVAYSEPVDVNTIFSSDTPDLPAVDIQGKIFYRKKGSGLEFSSVYMSNTDSGNYLGTIPAGVVESGDTIEYYIQSSFKGYSYTNSLDFSPTYSPDGVVSMGTTYYTPPTEYFEYEARRFVSDVATMTITMTNSAGGVTPIQMSLYSDEVWQGIIEMGEYEKVFLDISAANIKINTASIATNIVYGDGSQAETTPPLVATAKPGDPSIEVDGITNQQYVVRLDMDTQEYVLMACDAQNFDDWFLDSDFYAVGENSQGSANKWFVNFENWSTNNQQKLSVDFNDSLWVHPDSYDSSWVYPSSELESSWAQYQYQIWNTKLFNDPTNNIAVAQMEPGKTQGFMFPSSGNPIHPYGVGTVSFKYKVVDDNTYPVIADMTLTNTFISEVNYRVAAQVKAYGENLDDGNYHAIRLRQVDEFNYIEGRVVQTHGNRYYLEIWLCEAGVLSCLPENKDTGTDMAGYRGSLEEGGELVFKIQDDSADNVKVTLAYDSSVSDQVQLKDKVIEAPALYQEAAPYGFAASGANMIVSSYLVNSFAGTDLPWWEEDFNENEFSIMQFDANWVHVVTTNAADIVDGRMQRMGVGGLAGAPSTSIAVSLDPGDNTGAVPDNRTNWIDDYSSDSGLTNLYNLYYKDIVVNVHTADHAFAIIERLSAESELSIKFYDIEITGWVGALLTQDNWKNNYGWVQYENYIEDGITYTNNYIELRRSKTPAAARQYVASPQYSTLGSFGFEYMIPTNSAVPTVKVWKAANIANPATWTLLTANAVDPADARDEWLFFSRSVGDENDGYLIIENASAAGSNAIIRLDNITIYPNGGGSVSAWAAYNARLTGDEDVFEGRQSGFLNLNSTLNTLDDNDYNAYDPYIRSPRLPNGVGEISFWYAMLTNAAATLDYALLRIETSDTGDDADWDELITMEVSNQQYQFFSTNMFDVASEYVRFSNVTSTNGVPKRLAIDDLIIIDPYATSLDVQTVRTVPEQPLSTDIVKIQADLSNYKFGPYDIEPVTYYYYTTNLWAKWPTNVADGVLPMELISIDTNASPIVYTYQTIDSIPSNAPNTCVQYYVSVSYDGEVFADKTSPQIFRKSLPNPTWYEPINYYTTYGSSEYNNPYYIVYSCPPYAVWFNEVNVADGALAYGVFHDGTGTNTYVELTGKAGIDISNWKLDIYNYNGGFEDTYTIGANTTLANNGNGYGFFVFGAPTVQNKDMQLLPNYGTFISEEYKYLPSEGGLVLRRDMGAVEYKIAYNTENLSGQGFQYIGDDVNVSSASELYFKSLQLTGTGSNYYSFAWSWEEGFTPGTVNTLQTITGGGSNEFALIITDYWFDGATAYVVSEGTGAWNTPEIWFATNLTEAVPYWEALGGVSSEVSGNVVTQYFTIPTTPTSPTIYYRVQGQQ
ncbi:MAG: hypothetical protein PF692_00675 [Kiritimatiellae bacterium]|jgi:hypothetical protein|nr:hypothetical protein [Kiritimatiellia bacterium]